MYLSVVIPAYNEAKRIGPTLQSAGTWLARQSFDSELIVVNNRSTDDTADVVRSWMHQFPFLKLIQETHPGKGHAVQTGMLAAQGDIRLFMDADDSTTVDHFDRCRSYLEGGYDVVIGSLAVKGSTIVRGGGEPWWRVLLGKLGNLWIQLWAVPGVSDTQRGFKVFTAAATQYIFPKLTIFGWGFDVEVLAAARAGKFKIKEVPIRWNNDPDSKVNFWAYPQVLMQTMLVGWRRITGAYHGST